MKKSSVLIRRAALLTAIAVCAAVAAGLFACGIISRIRADGAALRAMFKKESELAKPEFTWNGETNLTVGVSCSAKLSVKGEAAVSITKVTGLPKGLSYKSGKITGTPAEKGAVAAKVTVALNSNAKKTWVCVLTFRIANLPSWVRGKTFTGAGVIGGKEAKVTLTVSSKGKVSGKFVRTMDGKSYSFEAASFATFKDGTLRPAMALQYGKKKCDLEIAIGQDPESGVSVAELNVTYGGKAYGEADIPL